MASLYKSLSNETGHEPDHPVISGYFNSPSKNFYKSLLGQYKSNDDDFQFTLFEENDSLKIKAENEKYHVVEGSGNRLQIMDDITQFVIENDSTLIQMNGNRTRWKLVE
jgi:hypothetical protein